VKFDSIPFDVKLKIIRNLLSGFYIFESGGLLEARLDYEYFSTYVGNCVYHEDLIEKQRIIRMWMQYELRTSPAPGDCVYVVMLRGKNFSSSTRGHLSSDAAVVEAYRIARNRIRSLVREIETEKRLR